MNLTDIEDLPREIKQGIKFIPVDTIDEVLSNALESPRKQIKNNL
jgi:ATP-dependent Lon protease